MDAWPRPRAPPRFAFLPGARSSRRWFSQTPSSFRQKLPSVSMWPWKLCSDCTSSEMPAGLSRGRATLPRSLPSRSRLLAGPLPPFRWGLAHDTAIVARPPAPPPSRGGPRGRAGSAPLFRAPESPRGQSVMSVRLLRSPPHFDVQPFTASCSYPSRPVPQVPPLLPQPRPRSSSDL